MGRKTRFVQYKMRPNALHWPFKLRNQKFYCNESSQLCPQKVAGNADDADAGQTANKQDKAARFLIAKSHLYPLVPISDVAKRQLSDPVVGVSSLDVCGLTPNAIELRRCWSTDWLRTIWKTQWPVEVCPITLPAHTNTHTLTLFSELLVGGRAVWIVGQTEGV